MKKTKYKICKFIDDNRNVTYRILVIPPKLFGFISREYYLYNFYVMSDYRVDVVFTNEDDAKKRIDAMVFEDNKKSTSLINTYEYP